MIYDPNYSIGELAKRYLQDSFKRDVAEAIIKQQVEEFEEVIRERVREEMLKVSIGTVEGVRSAYEMSEKLYLRIDIDGEIKEHTL